MLCIDDKWIADISDKDINCWLNLP